MIFIVHVLNLCNYFMAKDEKIQSGMMTKYIVKMMKHSISIKKKKRQCCYLMLLQRKAGYKVPSGGQWAPQSVLHKIQAHF